MKRISVLIIIIFLAMAGCSDTNENSMETISLKSSGNESFHLGEAKVVKAHLYSGEEIPVGPSPSSMSKVYAGSPYHPLIALNFPEGKKSTIEYGLVEEQPNQMCLFLSVETDGKYTESINLSQWIGCLSLNEVVDKAYLDISLQDGKHSLTLIGTLPETGFDNCIVSVAQDGSYEVDGWSGMP